MTAAQLRSHTTEKKTTDLPLVDLEPGDLTYIETQNPNLINNYLDLRKNVFAENIVTEMILKPNQKCNYELETHIVLAIQKNKCIGGAVLLVNEDPKKFLPLEDNNEFKLKEKFPYYFRKKNIQAEFTHFVIDKNYRDWRCSGNIFRKIHNICLERGVTTLFATAYPLAARRHKVSCQNINIGLELQILSKIELRPFKKEWNGFERQLIVVDFSHKYHHKDYR